MLRIRRSAQHTMPRFGHAMNTNANAMRGVATERHVKLSKANDWSRSTQAEPVIAVGSRSLTQQAPVQHANRTPGKAQSPLPSCRSGAAEPEHGSRHKLLRASPTSTAGPWSSDRSQRGAGSARRILGNPTSAGLPSARPNPSLNHRTRYGKHRKPGPRHMVHHREPGLRRLPPQAG